MKIERLITYVNLKIQRVLSPCLVYGIKKFCQNYFYINYYQDKTNKTVNKLHSK